MTPDEQMVALAQRAGLDSFSLNVRAVDPYGDEHFYAYVHRGDLCAAGDHCATVAEAL